MAREPKPWRRPRKGQQKKAGAWYAQLDKRKVWLAPAEATYTEASRALRALLAQSPGTIRIPTSLRVMDVISMFLARAAERRAEGKIRGHTLDVYDWFLRDASGAIGSVLAEKLRPHQVESWALKERWNQTTQKRAISALNVALNWAAKQGITQINPVAKMESPRALTREAILTGKQFDSLLETTNSPQLKDILIALRETGCRPGEACSVEASNVSIERETWTVANKTSRKTGKPTRTIYLSANVLEISRRLVAERPAGPIFLNRKGTPWIPGTLARQLKEEGRRLGFGKECVPYSLRHLYVTDCLEKGIPPATVAQLVGHSDLTMIMTVYNKLNQRTEHLLEAARKAAS